MIEDDLYFEMLVAIGVPKHRARVLLDLAQDEGERIARAKERES